MILIYVPFCGSLGLRHSGTNGLMQKRCGQHVTVQRSGTRSRGHFPPGLPCFSRSRLQPLILVGRRRRQQWPTSSATARACKVGEDAAGGGVRMNLTASHPLALSVIIIACYLMPDRRLPRLPRAPSLSSSGSFVVFLGLLSYPSQPEILAVADLEVLSAKRVRRQLEQEFGVDLAAERKQLDAMVMEVLADVTSANAVASADSATSIGADFHIDEGVTDAEDRTSGDRALAAELQRAEQPARPHRHAAAPLGGKLTKRKAAAAALVDDDGKPMKKVASGFTRPLLLSAELSALCGGATEVMTTKGRGVWCVVNVT